jgi:hypothetical protein
MGILANMANREDANKVMAELKLEEMVLESIKVQPTDMNLLAITNFAQKHNADGNMKARGAVQILEPVMSEHNVRGLLATMSLCELVGKEEGKESALLSADPETLRRLIACLRITLDGQAHLGIIWNLWGLVSALQKLCINDANKPRIAQEDVLDQLFRVLVSKAGDQKAVELSLKCLLEVSFLETAMNSIRANEQLLSTIREHARHAQPSPAQSVLLSSFYGRYPVALSRTFV